MIFLYSMLAYAILFFVVLTFLKAEIILDMTFWFFAAFLLLILAHFTSGLEFFNLTFIDIIPIIISYLLCVFLGNIVGRMLPAIRERYLLSIRLRTLSIICIIGALTASADLILHNQIILGKRIPNIQISAVSIIGSILSFNGLIPISYVWISFFRKNSKVSLLSVAAGCAYVSYGILSGGRQALFILSLTLGILSLFCYKKYRFQYIVGNVKKYRIILFSILIGVCIFFVIYMCAVSKNRGGFEHFENKLMHFQYVTGAYYTPQSFDAIEFMEEKFGMGLGTVEFMFYYSHELYTYNVLYHNYGESPALVTQLHWLCRRIPFLNAKFDKVIDTFQRTLEAQGLFGHTWGTGFQNFLIDYGRVGMYIMLFLLGLFAGCNWKIVSTSYSNRAILRQALLCVAAIFFMQFSPLAEYSWCWPFFTLLFINIKEDEE